jgi:ABC-type bacteriocin/lantibiotic exporter with double-glycine peptidase domain
MIVLNQIIITLLLTSARFTYPPTYQTPDFCYLQQPDGITCGPTSLAMLLNWYGNAATVEEVKNACKTKWFRFQGNDVGMTSPDSIPFAMWRWGISGRMGVGDLRLLKYYVSRGRPPIVLLRSSEQTWHYVVVIGYDEQNVVIANPGSGNKETLSNANFQGAWDFTSDMEGQKIQRKFDIYLQLVKLGDVKGQTFIVPFFAR